MLLNVITFRVNRDKYFLAFHSVGLISSFCAELHKLTDTQTNMTENDMPLCEHD